MDERETIGLLVCGSNHFIVRGPTPSREIAFALARYWSLIQIGQKPVPEFAAWRISTKEFREELTWAAITPAGEAISDAVAELLGELRARGIEPIS